MVVVTSRPNDTELPAHAPCPDSPGYELAQWAVSALYRRVRELNRRLGTSSSNSGSQFVTRQLVRDVLREVFGFWIEQCCWFPELTIEHLGFVYEVVMRFGLERATGPSLSLRSVERLGPPVTVNLQELLALPAGQRAKWLADRTGRKLSARLQLELKGAMTIDDLQVALAPLVDSEVTSAVLAPGSWVLQPSLERRRSGCHFTSRDLAKVVVRRTLGPLLGRLRGLSGGRLRPEQILDLKVCDPAMGSGAFLLEACRQLAQALVESWHDRGEELGVLEARRLVAEHCLYGVDRDPLAVELAKMSLWLLTQVPEESPARGIDRLARTAVRQLPLSLVVATEPPLSFLEGSLKCGDALVGEVLGERPMNRGSRGAMADCGVGVADRGSAEQSASTPVPCLASVKVPALSSAPGPPNKGFDWAAEFPEVFGRENPGFDAVVGNPPWVSYVGRAAQPLDPVLRVYYERTYESFRGYRNLQGLFVERSVRLTRAGGRVGLLLPSSMAELEGYAPVRAVHDRLAEPDAELADFGEDSFWGVFQPCMALTSTVRARAGNAANGHQTGELAEGPASSSASLSVSPRPCPAGAPWPLERPDLDGEARRLLEYLASLAPVPAELFGERGLQTTRGDRSYLAAAPGGRQTVPLRVGGDILPFRRGPASLWADPTWFRERLRSPEAWSEVRLLVRQTARVPVVALSDGLAFRNSLLAGFETPEYPAVFLVAYLNSTPIRWLHYHRNRDARMGMPQVKISHLRALPAPVPGRDLAPLAALGSELSARNSGITAAEQRQLDELVANLLELTPAQLERMWADTGKWSQGSHLCTQA